jgi:hypothetical protein
MEDSNMSWSTNTSPVEMSDEAIQKSVDDLNAAFPKRYQASFIGPDTSVDAKKYPALAEVRVIHVTDLKSKHHLKLEFTPDGDATLRDENGYRDPFLRNLAYSIIGVEAFSAPAEEGGYWFLNKLLADAKKETKKKAKKATAAGTGK